MAFEENKHPRDKGGKFTTKGNEGSKSSNSRQEELKNKYNSELPGKPKKEQLTQQEWALWYKAVAENKVLGYWAEELDNGNALLKVENKNSHKLIITGGTFEKPKAIKI